MTTMKHDPADRATCSYCGIAEDIHLLDGVLTANGDDSGLLACIKCYPADNGNASWCPTGIEHIAISIAPSLQPLYQEWLRNDTVMAWARYGVTIESDQSGSWSWAETDEIGNVNGPFSPSFGSFDRCVADLEDCFGSLQSQS
jgi:hypothetical protein